MTDPWRQARPAPLRMAAAVGFAGMALAAAGLFALAVLG